jgi:hypothetical protein
MTQRLLADPIGLWDEVVVVFANTGKEHPRTLEYVNNCDRLYGLGVVWVEAVVSPQLGEGTKHKVVTFETAARKGEPFEVVVDKYGLPNSQYPHCNRELKQAPITSYVRSLGWGAGSYDTAIGIRADEIDRISPKSVREVGAVYPLIDWRIRKEHVLEWESGQPVRLGIPEHLGNCVACWKKSFRKLATVAREMPEELAFPAYLEARYADHGRGEGDRRMFRGRKTTADIFKLARDPAFEPFVDGFAYEDETLDLGAACGETCEIGTDGSDEWGDETKDLI